VDPTQYAINPNAKAAAPLIPLVSLPCSYKDAPTEGIRRILEITTGDSLPRDELIDTSKIGSCRHLQN
jgi:hypothetical protein